MLILGEKRAHPGKLWVPGKVIPWRPRIWKPDEVEMKGPDGEKHYRLANEPLLSISKPLPVRCYKCGLRHVFEKSGPMGGWKPPMMERGRPGWVCPKC